jgi:hypothetical protein
MMLLLPKVTYLSEVILERKIDMSMKYLWQWKGSSARFSPPSHTFVRMATTIKEAISQEQAAKYEIVLGNQDCIL